MSYGSLEIAKRTNCSAWEKENWSFQITGVGAVTIVTNSTQILKYVKKAFTSYIYRWAHDASEIPLIALEFLIFGKYKYLPF